MEEGEAADGVRVCVRARACVRACVCGRIDCWSFNGSRIHLNKMLIMARNV